MTTAGINTNNGESTISVNNVRQMSVLSSRKGGRWRAEGGNIYKSRGAKEEEEGGFKERGWGKARGAGRQGGQHIIIFWLIFYYKSRGVKEEEGVRGGSGGNMYFGKHFTIN